MRKGSVTVFLTLLFACIMVFVTTFLRMARMRWAEASGERMLKASMDAVLTEYDKELFEDYRLFLLPEWAGGELRWDAKVKEYIEADLLGNRSYMNVGDVAITGRTFAVDGGNQEVVRQILQWMKYEVGIGFLEKVMGDVEAVGKDAAPLEEMGGEVEKDQEVVAQNQDMLRLLMYVEGIKTNNTGLDYSTSGKLQMTVPFAKMAAVGEVQAADAGVGEVQAADAGVANATIWETVKGGYWNPMKFHEKWEKRVRKKREGREGEKSQGATWEGIPEGEAAKWLEKVEGVRRKTEEAIEIIIRLQGKGVSEGESICDIEGMKVGLESNLEILQKAGKLKDVYELRGEGGLRRLSEYFRLQRKEWEGYSVRNLVFDYSSLNPKEGVKNPFASLGAKLGNGILGLLLVDEGDVSEAALEQADQRYRLSQATVQEEKEWDAEDVEKAVNGNDGKGVLDFLDAFLGQSSSDGALGGYGGAIIKNLSLNEYALIFLAGYGDEGGEGRKETVLRYEWEYMVFGKREDKGNLTAMANRLLLIRTGMNLLHVMTDAEKRRQTYLTATALVGFTCMEALVRLTQVSLMVGWAWEEAVVDVAALLKGHAVPVIKTRENFQVKYEDTLRFGKGLVKEKMEEYSDGKKAGSLDYKGYLRLFLLGVGENVKTCRIMDVIQANMRHRYRDDFSFDNCLSAFRVKATYQTREGLFQKDWECAY